MNAGEGKLANIKEWLNQPDNRNAARKWLILILVVIGIVSVFLMDAFSPKRTASSASISSKVSAEDVAFGTGKESPAYLDTLETYNRETLQEYKKQNPSALPIPILGDAPAQGMCADGYRTWQDCLMATIGDGDLCRANDTACMIENNLIPADLCAPADYDCMELKGLSPETLLKRLMEGASGPALCDKSDIKCIARLASEYGCEVDDAACLVANGIISPLCAANDAGCIAIVAAKVGCDRSDSACLIREGVIAPLCESTDSACIEREAARLGCDSSDISCLVKKGIVRASVAEALCEPLDTACISKHAKLAGCDTGDIACLVRNGIVAPACQRGDLKCIEKAAKAVGCEKTDRQCLVRKGVIGDQKGSIACLAGDQQCIERNAKKYGCDPKDKACLVRNKVIEALCAPNDIQCIAKEAVKAGCSPSDTACLVKAGIIGEGGVEQYEQALAGTLSGPKERGDGAQIAAVQESGCKDDDTLCMRAAGVISRNDCAPKDAKCAARKLVRESNSSASMRTRNQGSGDADYADNSYSEKLADKEYMKQMASHLRRVQQFQNASSVEVGFWAKPEEAGETKATPDPESVGSDSIEQAPTQQFAKSPLFKAGKAYYAINEIGLNTDIEGPVAVSLIKGNGEVFVAQGTMVHKDQLARLELNQLIHPNGEMQPINAIVLDPQTGYAAMASEVDNHLLYRYGWWGVGNALRAAGIAAKLAAKEVIVTENGTVIESSELTAKQELLVALGELGSSVGSEFAKRLERPSTVYVHPNEEMAVYFMETAYDETISGAIVK